MPILSFSIPAMLPAVAQGVLTQGEMDFKSFNSPDELWERIEDQSELNAEENFFSRIRDRGGIIKKQTIRPYDFRDPNLRSPWYRLRPGHYCDIWWKQRAPKLAFKIGSVKIISVQAIEIENKTGSVSATIYNSRPALPYLDHLYSTDIKVKLNITHIEELSALAMADGFLNIDDFREFFVPNYGDVFRGVLIAW